jgi:hypothetical protein
MSASPARGVLPVPLRERHPVYDNQEPGCPWHACQEHKPQLLAAGDHSTPAAVPPGTGEALIQHTSAVYQQALLSVTASA